jgi:hypothetical protein
VDVLCPHIHIYIITVSDQQSYMFFFVHVLQVYAEIKEVCGSNLALSLSDVKQLHYLMASLHESARLLPTAPFLQRCSLQSGKTIQMSLKKFHITPNL